MDNKAYLDQIAVKQKASTGPLFSPALIKLIVGALALIVILIAVASILTSTNKADNTSYRELILRLRNISNEEGSFVLEQENLRSSKLVSEGKKFVDTSSNLASKITEISAAAGIDMSNPRAEAIARAAQDDLNTAATLETAFMNGNLDRAYATEASYQINIILQLIDDILKTTDNDSLATTLDTNKTSFETYLRVFDEYTKNN